MKKKYYIRLVIGSLLFGFSVFGKELYDNGNWNASGLLYIAYGSLSFGLLFHLLFSFFIKKIDNNDK